MMLSMLNTLSRRGIPRYAQTLRHGRLRSYSSSVEGETVGDITGISLAQPVSWIPVPKYATIKKDHSSYNCEVTTLENGLKVASEEKFGSFCTIGVLIDSGSRYETMHPSGISHFLEKLAFGATSKYANKDAILQKLESHGGICDCQGSRDTLIYAVSANITGLEEVVELLADVSLKPQFTPDEIEMTRTAVKFELESLEMRPDPEPLLVELIHSVSYSGNSLGMPKFTPKENVVKLDRSSLYTYMHHYHTPDRMVLAGVGMKHQTLVDYAKEYFLNVEPVWKKEAGLVDTKYGLDSSISQYTGGIVRVEKDLSNVSLGPNPMPELAHCVLGLEGCSHEDPDFVTFCVLNMIMGGGGSFSAGGPGKGMYTRLHTNVLNQHHWMDICAAQHHSYRDSGIFCIHAAAHPKKMRDLVQVIAGELVSLKHGVGVVELNRAKTQLHSLLLMNLESRPVIFEDIGRQVLVTGKRFSAEYFCDKIANVTEDDIIRVSNRMLSSKASVACLGDLSYLPNFDDIQSALISKDGQFPKRFSLFK